MTIDEKIEKINQVLKEYFESHPSEREVLALDMMDRFVAKGIFNQDREERKGLPIRKLLRELSDEKRLDEIHFVDKRAGWRKWFFCKTKP